MMNMTMGMSLGGGRAVSQASVRAQVITFPLAFGPYSTDCDYLAATDAIGPNGAPFALAAVLMPKVATFVESNEICRKGDPDSGYTAQAYTGDSLRCRHHDGAGAAQAIGSLVDDLTIGEFIHVLWWFDGVSTARSYRNGVFVGQTTITGAETADAGSLFQIPGPAGQPELDLAYLWASGNSTGLGSLDTDAKVWAWWESVRDAMLAGDEPPAYTGYDLFASAAAANVGVNPQNWVVSGPLGGTLTTSATAPPAVRRSVPVVFSAPNFPVPTLTAPTDGQEVVEGEDVTVSASFSRTDLVTEVAWFANGAEVASGSTSPFSATWAAPAIGSYEVFCRATYIDGSTADSAPVDVEVAAAVTPDAIFGANLIKWRRSDDATQSGGTLTGWADRVDATALTAILGAPTVNTADATLNNLPSITFDGVDDAIQWLMDRPVPDVSTPTTLIFVLKQVTFTASDAICGTANNVLAITQTTSPNMVMRNTTAGPNNNGAPVGQWRLVVASYTGSTADSLRVGSVTVTGTNVGITNPGATFTLGARTGAALFSNIAVGEAMALQSVPTVGELASLVAYITDYYAGAVGT